MIREAGRNDQSDTRDVPGYEVISDVAAQLARRPSATMCNALNAERDEATAKLHQRQPIRSGI